MRRRGAAAGSDAERVDRALDQLQGAAGPDRRRTRRRVLAVLGATAVLTLVAGVAGVVAAHGDPSPARSVVDEVPVWREVLGLSASSAGLVLAVLGLTRLVRSRAWSAGWDSPLLVLSHAQRRALGRQLRAQAPVEVDQLPLTRDLARRTIALAETATGPQSLLMLGSALLLGGNGVRTGERWLVAPALVTLAMWPVSLLLVRRGRRDAAAFLAGHPEPGAAPVRR